MKDEEFLQKPEEGKTSFKVSEIVKLGKDNTKKLVELKIADLSDIKKEEYRAKFEEWWIALERRLFLGFSPEELDEGKPLIL